MGQLSTPEIQESKERMLHAVGPLPPSTAHPMSAEQRKCGGITAVDETRKNTEKGHLQWQEGGSLRRPTYKN